ncbi:hypothetical protein SAMN05660461_4026 [Chitinophaga ginsengisegetis]|jgi:hypothetical protein|uniref:Uncharacterized protein n=1 Tax=Chitinophaga ginsengisegetis TaxID=393003 RepID=A0A1T5P5U9_9BACT|nr:hypothetical protein [Chitinophaga ginsengisegetis]MDR6566393.1 hypothetical protein [Chitinophaga ginsengisegetis]MDR6646123.1 hypothetical protein [Chitinophaga ginsengisegetis]MDR6651285.1 hypothetical protein [Chitinophaga ginsengisegetis]SKD08075.1 hypothetical protein SAMN05660461_4026 [Chitinophaga ginsengisegetis]
MSKEPINVLLDIHTKLSSLPVLFREKVCEECNWSTPTFYRKMRGRDKPNPNEKGKIIPALSNAEKQRIIEIMEEVFASGEDDLEKYRKPSK